MDLSQTEQAVLKYLSVPRTAVEVMKFLDHKTPPYGILRLLQRLDLVDRISPYDRAKATFVASNRAMKVDECVVVNKEPQTVFGVRL